MQSDCNEFMNNLQHLNSKGVPLAAKLDNVRNILYMDTCEGREVHARIYQCSDLYFKSAGN